MEYERLDHDIGFMWSLTSVARHKVLGEETAKHIDVPLIYGDYFFAEGIAQLNGYEEQFW
ncbi:hypothetical protein [Paenibacillus prosopidis]|uniref:hypothetical protein n=1 Tax=Paenibacillus prosopidis TaxID=630520 RepID=UPI0011C06632|nr:hypothetical protein [Paenibacillus prosopidis]